MSSASSIHASIDTSFLSARMKSKAWIENTLPSLQQLVSDAERTEIWQVIETKAKPPGALGELEPLMAVLTLCARARGRTSNEILLAPGALVFGGDHGIAEEGVSIASSEVTAQMVETIMSGGASVSVCAHQNNIPLEVVDCGILHTHMLNESIRQRLVSCRLGDITGAIHREDAMSIDQAKKGFDNGRTLTRARCQRGMDLLCVGEIGIGNTSAAAALLAGLTGLQVDQCVGRGTGISEQAFAYKRQLLKTAILRHNISERDHPLELAARLGGFELVTMAGAMLGAAECHVPTVVDGFVSTVCALLACTLVPNVRDYLIFSHHGAEHGHAILLELLNAHPLMSLGLRIGEGTGAVMAVSLIKSALACYTDMASFTQVGISL